MNVRVIAIVGMLIAIGPGDSVAMPPQDLPGEIKACKAIADNTGRLKCFDALLAEDSEQPKAPDKNQTQQPATEKQANWSIDEKQLADGNRDVVALNFLGDDAVCGSIIERNGPLSDSAKMKSPGWSSDHCPKRSGAAVAGNPQKNSANAAHRPKRRIL
jgi:hypothetical protein